MRSKWKCWIYRTIIIRLRGANIMKLMGNASLARIARTLTETLTYELPMKIWKPWIQTQEPIRIRMGQVIRIKTICLSPMFNSTMQMVNRTMCKTSNLNWIIVLLNNSSIQTIMNHCFRISQWYNKLSMAMAILRRIAIRHKFVTLSLAFRISLI